MIDLVFYVELNGKYVKSYKHSLQKALEYAFKLLDNPINSVAVWDNYHNMYDPKNYR